MRSIDRRKPTLIVLEFCAVASTRYGRRCFHKSAKLVTFGIPLKRHLEPLSSSNCKSQWNRMSKIVRISCMCVRYASYFDIFKLFISFLFHLKLRQNSIVNIYILDKILYYVTVCQSNNAKTQRKHFNLKYKLRELMEIRVSWIFQT